jgi:hypothetical protein
MVNELSNLPKGELRDESDEHRPSITHQPAVDHIDLFSGIVANAVPFLSLGTSTQLRGDE